MKRIFLGFFLASTLSTASFAENPDWNQVMQLIKNLTNAINGADATAKDYLVFIKEHLPEIEKAIRENWPEVWPEIKNFLSLFGQLPNSISDASQYLMVGFIVVGVCVVISTVVCAGSMTYGFCKRQPRVPYNYAINE